MVPARVFALIATATAILLVGWLLGPQQAWSYDECLAPLCIKCDCFCEADYQCELKQCDLKEGWNAQAQCYLSATNRYQACKVDCLRGGAPRNQPFARSVRTRGPGMRCGGFRNWRCAPGLYCKLSKTPTVGVCTPRGGHR